MAKKALLLVNLGTPDSPSFLAVAQYLKEFLSDPRVIDLPWIFRQALVNGFIVPFRSRKSTHAYRSIWQMEGSPLLIHSRNLQSALAQALGSNFDVLLAMRYGQPKLESLLKNLDLRPYSELIVLPLFPQYASATTGSIFDQIFQSIRGRLNLPKLTLFNQFYQNSAFINASTGVYQSYLNNLPPDQLPDFYLFSFHGLPIRQLQKLNLACGKTCDIKNPCAPVDATVNNLACYRAQCYASAKAIAEKLGLQPEQYTISFQSRLGRLPWIPPYTEDILQALAKKGIRNLAIACPSFVSDCLETLEEIGIQAKSTWTQVGGRNLYLLPCLNADPLWVKELSEQILNSSL
ncbi:MAG: ferrochelatase [Gammaproteobacteria bacterium]